MLEHHLTQDQRDWLRIRYNSITRRERHKLKVEGYKKHGRRRKYWEACLERLKQSRRHLRGNEEFSPSKKVIGLELLDESIWAIEEVLDGWAEGEE